MAISPVTRSLLGLQFQLAIVLHGFGQRYPERMNEEWLFLHLTLPQLRAQVPRHRRCLRQFEGCGTKSFALTRCRPFIRSLTWLILPAYPLRFYTGIVPTALAALPLVIRYQPASQLSMCKDRHITGELCAAGPEPVIGGRDGNRTHKVSDCTCWQFVAHINCWQRYKTINNPIIPQIPFGQSLRKYL